MPPNETPKACLDICGFFRNTRHVYLIYLFYFIFALYASELLRLFLHICVNVLFYCLVVHFRVRPILHSLLLQNCPVEFQTVLQMRIQCNQKYKKKKKNTSPPFPTLSRSQTHIRAPTKKNLITLPVRDGTVESCQNEYSHKKIFVR